MMYGLKKASLFDSTNLELLKQGRIVFNDMAEALRFHGVVRLATRFESGKRGELWSTVDRKYMPTVEFGKSDMGCDRFKEIFSAQRYSKQLPSRPSNLSSEQYRWMIFYDHVANFNKNRARNYHP